MSGYRELYKELVPSQSLITDYLVKEKKITEVPEEVLPCRSDDVILSSSDESDLAPIHKRLNFALILVESSKSSLTKRFGTFAPVWYSFTAVSLKKTLFFSL
ncbi:hypothetical protein TNCV_960971 [Trichonephila clavipes]|uniref:Uncharacterized protein n=1 Tax=Trichonephila clavipes TaxID=2585209 RepID=A0A8X6S419_TRICX|nr:hypothetical protein TNCV_960971 [Trichonephila clavipes]